MKSSSHVFTLKVFFLWRGGGDLGMLLRGWDYIPVNIKDLPDEYSSTKTNFLFVSGQECN